MTLSAKSTPDDFWAISQEICRMQNAITDAYGQALYDNAVGEASLSRALVSLRVLALRMGYTLTPVGRPDESAKLRGLLWFAWHEFNAIRARHGAPITRDLMPTCTEEWWSEMTDAFAAAIGEDAQKPWPSKDAHLTGLTPVNKEEQE